MEKVHPMADLEVNLDLLPQHAAAEQGVSEEWQQWFGGGDAQVADVADTHGEVGQKVASRLGAYQAARAQWGQDRADRHKELGEIISSNLADFRQREQQSAADYHRAVQGI